ncbi:MAG TPA: type VII secretion protein EccE, partial [Streptosporangiaceae bacterium]|nr:type VII secretion protein EccE [Streptosporangiaceae bacterium]
MIVIVALTRRGPVQWSLMAVVALGLGLTVPRWRRRWPYQWLLTAWGFRRAGHMPGGPVSLAPAALTAVSPAAEVGAGQAKSPAASLPADLKPSSRSRPVRPEIDVSPVRARNGSEAGIVRDDDGFVVIIAIMPGRDSPALIDLPFEALAGLLDPPDALISAVQVVLQNDLAAHDAATMPAAAYRAAGHHRVPRSQSAWVALRHDPAVSGYGIGSAGSARDLHASLLRSLAGRAIRSLDLLAGFGLRGVVLDAEAARGLLIPELVSADAGVDASVPAQTSGPHRWKGWHAAGQRHTTYGLGRWPSGGIVVLQPALAMIPARSVTTAVVLTARASGAPALTATVRVTTGPASTQRKVTAAVTAAAASCGARLIRMDGEHATGVLATLPLGRGPAPAARWLGAHGGRAREALTTIVPVAAGGVVLGPGPGGQPVAIPFFAGTGGTRCAVLGDPVLPRLLALRALGTGARLQVVTNQSSGWLRLGRAAQLPAGCMTVVRPGTPPPSDGTRAAPWLIIDDTGSPAADGSRPWQAVVTVPAEMPEAGALAGLDAILLPRTTAAG